MTSFGIHWSKIKLQGRVLKSIHVPYHSYTMQFIVIIVIINGKDEITALQLTINKTSIMLLVFFFCSRIPFRLCTFVSNKIKLVENLSENMRVFCFVHKSWLLPYKGGIKKK